MSSNTKYIYIKKKIANFINNQLECLFFFSYKTKNFMPLPNQNLKHPKTQSESQHSQNSQHSTSTSKL